MNKQDIFKYLEQYNLDKDKYIVISGAAMVLLDLKEQTTDIDIAVEESYYNYLINNYNCEFERINKYGKRIYMIDNIINFGVTYYDTDIKIINNIKVQTENEILKLKKKLNREKDKKDIIQIKKYIKTKSNK